MRGLWTFMAFSGILIIGCSHLQTIETPPTRDPAQTDASATGATCDDPPCTDPENGSTDPHAHWLTGLRNDNVEDFGLAGTMTLALTFDDGPGDGTRAIQELLDKEGIEVAFFHIGKNVKAHPILEAMDHKTRADGRQHIIGNHSYTHPDLSEGVYTKDNQALYRQMIETDHVIKHQMGAEDFYSQSNGVLYFRAPFGNWTPADARILRKKQKDYPTAAADLARYYGPIYWDIGGEIDCANPKPNAKNSLEKCDTQELTDAADWDCWDNKMPVEQCAQGYLNKIESLKGGVILSHEIYKNTPLMWAILIPKLKALGYHFVRLDRVPNVSRVKLPKALLDN